MAQNLIDLIDEEDVEVFRKASKPRTRFNSKDKFNPKTDNQEKIRKQRKERQKMRENAYKDTEEQDFNV